MTLAPDLMAILACPKCKKAVRQQEHPPAVICDKCQLSYPVRDGIPVMLIDEASSSTEV